ncbi:MAG: hypothetical protein PHX00_02640, partial [Synergistaceae bacterium]|nr:hypothetical protein [Synergistaceae bacterium]
MWRIQSISSSPLCTYHHSSPPEIGDAVRLLTAIIAQRKSEEKKKEAAYRSLPLWRKPKSALFQRFGQSFGP